MEQRPQRKPTRLPNFNYNEAGSYFLTLCTKEKSCIFGQVLAGETEADMPVMQLSPVGDLVSNQIQTMVNLYTDISVDCFVVMPNHVHLLLSIRSEEKETTPANAVVPRFISTLKRFTNRQANEELWQRSYHDHVVRNEQDYRRIWRYIESNAAKWKEDCFYTA